jgi:hypothetical protein
LACR